MADFDPGTGCRDCGTAKKWKYAGAFGDNEGYPSYYCKRCHTKAGYCNGVTIDLDSLEAVVSRFLTDPAPLIAAIIAEGMPGHQI